MYVSLLEEIQLIQTLSGGIEHMIIAVIATETIRFPESQLEERARQIREQLQLLSNEISQSINRST